MAAPAPAPGVNTQNASYIIQVLPVLAVIFLFLFFEFFTLTGYQLLENGSHVSMYGIKLVITALPLYGVVTRTR